MIFVVDICFLLFLNILIFHEHGALTDSYPSFETTEGNVETLKEKVEIDEANKKVTLTALEGHCLDLYRTYKVIFQIVPKSEGGSVKVTIEYEKLNENVPPPTKYIDFIVNLFKDIDAHALKA